MLLSHFAALMSCLFASKYYLRQKGKYQIIFVKKDFLQPLLRLLVSVVFLIVLSRLIDVKVLREALPLIRLDIVGLATVLYFGTIAIRAWRLQLILNADTFRINFRDALVVTLIGFTLNLFIPATLGDVVRSYYGYKMYGIKEEMLSTSLVDKMFALCSLFLIGTVSGSFMGYAVLALISFLCAGLTMLPLFFPALFPWDLLNGILRRFRISLDRERLVETFRLSTPRKIVVMALSLSVWLWTSMFFYVLCTAFPVEVSLGYVVVIMPMITIVRLFPFTINALGPAEVAVTYFFHLIGIPSTLAVTISLVANISASIVPGMAGFVCILVWGHRGKNNRFS
ncbi:hypothetical protein CSA56_02070 [candidate division KSB3 bacterium]|uniref:Lysylphosphatidylglycerol synthetase n=1 Tax=candidate division KSB3 bacterium TaxID=2044937 RepID=A0A2G6KJX0_9BACT|nr:MAG: hypothetical protein CSA56_02070 [candidate division KSB3 bacterium]